MTVTTADRHEFNPGAAWSTIKKYASKLGTHGLESALVAWHVATDPAVDSRARATVIGALVYLGVPIDAIPDAIPVAGLTDDVTVLIAAVAAIAWAKTEAHTAAARTTMAKWGL